YEAAAEAVDRARKGDGPSLIECKTWRHRGHFEGDPCIYKDPKEQEAWLKKDPVLSLEKKLTELKFATVVELEEIKAAVKEKIDSAVLFAQNSPDPDPDDVLTDVYAS
ncbi:MAG: thiamine pyrophosphate-dependent enzyme, partial [Bacillota bacterium]